ncbi:MAG: VWA domain-containing protein [Candidatus Acidiferrales bacterium]
MRLIGVAVGIIALALAGYATIGTVAARAAGAAQSDQGPMLVQSSEQPRTDQQPQQPPPATSQTLKVQTNLVNVFVTARDKKNAILTDLKQDDFKIYEDGVEQKVAYFSKDMNLPITLAVLIDTSGSMQNILDAEQDAATRFIKTVMRKKDEAVVISFDFDVNLLADFTEDPVVLDRAIHSAQISAVSSGGVVTPGTVPQGSNRGTDLYDAVYLACHDELATEAGRKAVVVLSDAEDTGSKVSLNDAIEAAQRSDAVIHFLRLADEPFYFGMGMSYGGSSVARKMADETGGREVEIRSEKNLESAFDLISEELRSQYVLGYYPSNTKHDGTFRKIKVEVSRPGTKILARKGYYAPVK